MTMEVHVPISQVAASLDQDVLSFDFVQRPNAAEDQWFGSRAGSDILPVTFCGSWPEVIGIHAAMNDDLLFSELPLAC